MKYFPLIAVVMLFLGAIYLRWRTSQPRKSDFEAIETYAAVKGLKVEKIIEGREHWYYWLRGNLLLSNIARTYVIEAATADCKRTEIHVAVDPLSPGELKVLQENSLPNS